MTRAGRLISSWPVRVLVTCGLLGMVLSHLDVEALLRGLLKAHASPFVAALIAIAFARVFAAARMCIVLRRHRVQLSLLKVVAINLRTAFVSFLLPGQIVGGVVRWQLLTRQGAGRTDALTAIGFDRLSDFSALVLIGFICSLLSHDQAAPGYVPFLLGFVLAGALVLQSVLLSEQSVVVARAIGTWLGLLKWSYASRVFGRLEVSACAFRALPAECWVRIWGWSLASNIAGLASYYWLARAADLDLGIFELGWVRSAITTLSMLPLTIAGLGVREGAMIPLLASYGVTPLTAVTFSLLLFLVGILVALAGGALIACDVLTGRGWHPKLRPSATP